MKCLGTVHVYQNKINVQGKTKDITVIGKVIDKKYHTVSQGQSVPRYIQKRSMLL